MFLHLELCRIQEHVVRNYGEIRIKYFGITYFAFGIRSHPGVGRIRDSVDKGLWRIQDYVTFGSMSHLGVCRIRGYVDKGLWIKLHLGVCRIWDYVTFGSMSQSGLCRIPDYVQIQDYAVFRIMSHSGLCCIWVYVTFEIMSHLGYVAFVCTPSLWFVVRGCCFGSCRSVYRFVSCGTIQNFSKETRLNEGLEPKTTPACARLHWAIMTWGGFF